MDAIGRQVDGPDWAESPRIFHTGCRCSLKTQLVPQSHLQAWRRAMRHSPFGPAIVSIGGATCAPGWRPHRALR
eukprot:569751-Lingulodinium_polyedra.AAC.1